MAAGCFRRGSNLDLDQHTSGVLLSAICRDVNFINARLELHVQVELEPTGHEKTAAESRDGASRTDLSNNVDRAQRVSATFARFRTFCATYCPTLRPISSPARVENL